MEKNMRSRMEGEVLTLVPENQHETDFLHRLYTHVMHTENSPHVPGEASMDTMRNPEDGSIKIAPQAHDWRETKLKT
jgi:hypothetical protein